MDVRATTSFRREPGAVPAARSFVRHALRSVGAHGEAVERLVLAAAEAFNNAVLHASGDTFAVRVVIAETTCTITISDAGHGFRPPDHPRMPSAAATGHRGLALMEALVDVVDLRSTPSGTQVALVHPLFDGERSVLADS